MKKYINELIGTFFFVLLGCGIAVMSNSDMLLTSLGFGLSFIVINNILESHINPAVSLSIYLINKINLKDFILYSLFQIIGSILAAYTLSILLNGTEALGANNFGNCYLANTSESALLIESLLSFIFISVILSVKDNKCLITGITIIILIMFGINFTGASFNPARSIGPAIITGGFPLYNLWVFIIAPLFGSSLASLFYLIKKN